MKIYGVILAAGTSSRMGTVNKLLLEYRGHTIVQEVVTQVQGAEVDGVVIVTGFESHRIESALATLMGPGTEFVYNDKYRLGRAESIKCAIDRIGGLADAALFMVADKPGVTTDLINKAIRRFKSERPAVLYIGTPAGRGHPIIFSETVFDDLMSLEGDFCGNDLISKYSENLVELRDDATQMDIDSEDDYRILLENGRGNKGA